MIDSHCHIAGPEFVDDLGEVVERARTAGLGRALVILAADDEAELRQAEEVTPVAEVCRKAGISEASFYSLRKKYGGLMPSEMKRLKLLEEENARLKKLVADLSLDKAMLQVVVKRKL